MIGGEDIVIKVDGEAVTLRPSLRAACRLEREHGFPAIFDGITNGRVVILATVIREAGAFPAALLNLLAMIEQDGAPALDVFKAPLLTLVAAMIGIEDDTNKKKPGKARGKPGKGMTFADYFQHLFEIGTGWLGWTPAETWSATPAEIVAAHKGRVDMLRAIFGGNDAQAESRKSMSLSDKVNATMTALGAKVVKPKKDAA